MALTKTPVCDFGKKAENFKLQSINNKSVSLEEIKEMDCADDMLSLLEDWEGKPFWDKNKIPTLEITLSALEPEYRNKKIGHSISLVY